MWNWLHKWRWRRRSRHHHRERWNKASSAGSVEAINTQFSLTIFFLVEFFRFYWNWLVAEMRRHYLWSKHIVASVYHPNATAFYQPTTNFEQPKCIQRKWANQHWNDPKTNPPVQRFWSVNRWQIQERHKLFRYQNQRSKSAPMEIPMAAAAVVLPVHLNRPW